MKKTAIITRWIQTEKDGIVTNELAIFSDISPIDGDTWRDITAQHSANIPPTPNIVIVEVVCADATLAAIKAHAQYGALAVLWEGDPTQSPVVTEPQYDAFANWLLNKAKNNGFPNATLAGIRTALGGANSNGRTRYEIAQTLIAWLRARPKG